MSVGALRASNSSFTGTSKWFFSGGEISSQHSILVVSGTDTVTTASPLNAFFGMFSWTLETVTRPPTLPWKRTTLPFGESSRTIGSSDTGGNTTGMVWLESSVAGSGGG